MNIYKKNFLLIFCIFLILGVIIQSGLCILSASQQSAEQVRNNIGANVLVKNDDAETGDIYYGKNMLSMETVLKIANLPEVTSYSPLGFSFANGTDGFKPFMTEAQADMSGFTNQFRIQGCCDISQLSEFISGDNELIQGRNLEPEDNNVAIISSEIAKQNEIQVK